MRPVGREEIATALGIPLHRAKFHLDRLADEGLLGVDYQRISGRDGPGAGRPAKVYHRRNTAIETSLPHRRHDVAATILADALTEREVGEKADGAVRVAARGAGVRTHLRSRQRCATEEEALALLSRHGYEPQVEEAVIVLRNCPFEKLRRTHPELAREMSVAYVDGLLNGEGGARWQVTVSTGGDGTHLLVSPVEATPRCP